MCDDWTCIFRTDDVADTSLEEGTFTPVYASRRSQSTFKQNTHHGLLRFKPSLSNDLDGDNRTKKACHGHEGGLTFWGRTMSRTAGIRITQIQRY